VRTIDVETTGAATTTGADGVAGTTTVLSHAATTADGSSEDSWHGVDVLALRPMPSVEP
jgi:hypothetical protein